MDLIKDLHNDLDESILLWSQQKRDRIYCWVLWKKSTNDIVPLGKSKVFLSKLIQFYDVILYLISTWRLFFSKLYFKCKKNSQHKLPHYRFNKKVSFFQRFNTKKLFLWCFYVFVILNFISFWWLYLWYKNLESSLEKSIYSSHNSLSQSLNLFFGAWKYTSFILQKLPLWFYSDIYNLNHAWYHAIKFKNTLYSHIWIFEKLNIKNELFRPNLDQYLPELHTFLNISHSEIESVLYHMKNVRKDWLFYSSDFEDKIEIWNKLLSSFKILHMNTDTIWELAWYPEIRKYLIVFQNNDEIRPTWGFIWSVWFLDIFNGKVENLTFEDIYALEWKINKNKWEKIPVPEWINKITSKFWLRDSNNEIDVAKSAKQMQYFLDQWGYDIDGIIFINQEVIKNILWYIGDIKMEFDISWEKITQVISEENFSEVISTLVEAKTFKLWTLWTPKKVLFEFAHLFLSKIEKNGIEGGIIKSVLSSILKRDIIFYSFLPKENSLLWKLWVNGDIAYNKSIDFNYPVYMNIWGGKTDRYYSRQYIKNTKQYPDCSFHTQLTIKGSHGFWIDEEKRLNWLIDRYNIQDPNIIFIQWKTENKSFVQVLLPKNAIIKYNSNYMVDSYPLYKKVSFYTSTKRLETIKNIIEYTIPNPECRKYSYMLYKQPWIQHQHIDFYYNGYQYNEAISSDFKYLAK